MTKHNSRSFLQRQKVITSKSSSKNLSNVNKLDIFIHFLSQKQQKLRFFDVLFWRDNCRSIIGTVENLRLWHNFQWRFWNRIRRNLHAVPTVKNAPRSLPSLPEVNLNFGNKQMAKRTSGLNLYVCTGNLFCFARKIKWLEKNFLFYDHYCTYNSSDILNKN